MTSEKGQDTTELHLTVLKAVKVLFKRPYCQLAPTISSYQRENVFYFPEEMLRQAGDKNNDKKFAAEVWTSLFLKGPTVVDIVSTNIQLIIEQYMSGQRSCFGLRYSSALADKQKLLMIRDRSLADTKEEPAEEKATPWQGKG